MNENHLISIIIPVYNREDLIEETVRSALTQTYKNIEIIVVDNKSTDNTWKRLQELAKDDNRIKIFQNDSNIGPVLNWKRCIEKASGKYTKILFSDDILDKKFISKAVPLINGSIAFVFSSVRIGKNFEQTSVGYKFKKHTGTYPLEEFIDASLYGGDVPISPGCALFHTEYLKKNLILNIKSPTIHDFLEHGAGPDLLLYLMTFRDYSKFSYLDEPLIFFREHEGSISVADKDKYLFKCYVQTKLWFAKLYFNHGLYKKYFAQTWFFYLKYMKKFEFPNKFIQKYSNEGINLNKEIMMFFVSKLFHRIKRYTK